MKTSYSKVCESAEFDHGIKFYSMTIRSREVTLIRAEQRATMLKHAGDTGWVGTYREARDVSLGDTIHRVKGTKGAVAEWLVRALVDGPSSQYAEYCGVEYSARIAQHGAMAPGRSPTHLRSDFA